MILTIAKKELHSYFDSVGGYVVLILFLTVTGIFTWITDTNILYIGQADLGFFFSIAQWTLFFFVPAITMKSFSEEQNAGTLDLLLTKPVAVYKIVLGKFLGYFWLILVALALTLPYYFTVMQLGDVNHVKVFAGYVALMLSGALFVSIGIFASTLTSNQVVAFLIALALSSVFQIIADAMVPVLPVSLGQISDYLSAPGHFWSVARGVFDTRDFVFFLSFTVFWLYASVQMLNLKKW